MGVRSLTLFCVVCIICVNVKYCGVCLYEFVLFVGNSTVKMRMKESEMCLDNDNRDLRNDQ